MKLVEIKFVGDGKHKPGWQLHVAGRHVHHALLGFVFVLHDIRDWRRWFSDLWRPGAH